MKYPYSEIFWSIFSHIWTEYRDTPYLSLFSPNAGKYRPEKLRIRTLFSHCNLVEPNLWFYCQTNENPSDLITRVCRQDFTKNNLWREVSQVLKENGLTQVHTKLENNDSLT